MPDAALVERVATGLGFDDPWRGIEAVAREFLVPAFERGGLEGLRVLVEQKATSPWAAAALVELAARQDLSPGVFFTRDELVSGAATYLVDASFDHKWAWMAVLLGDFDAEEHWDIVMALVECAPDHDDALWRIGDGPIAALQMRPGASRRITDAATSKPKLARILQLVRELP